MSKKSFKQQILSAWPFVASIMGINPESKEKLDFDDDQKATLDAAIKKDGFAEKFMTAYNEHVAETEEENEEAVKAYNEFLEGLKASENPEEDDPEKPEASQVPSTDDKSMAAMLSKLTKIAAQFQKTAAQQAADIAKLKTTPEEDEPEAVIQLNPNSQKAVKHSKTHLFASNQDWDNLDRPWNKAVANFSNTGEIKTATDWNKVNIDKLNEDLGAYSRRNASEIMSLLMDGYDIPANWSIVSNIQDQYVFSSIVTGEVTQAYKQAWLPKNKQRFVPIINKIFDKQIDLEWTPKALKAIEKSWLNMFFNEGSTPYKESFVRFLIGEIIKKARKEDKISIFKGVYYDTDNLPEGVSGSFLNAMDGFLKLVSDNKNVTYKPHSSTDIGVTLSEITIYDYVNAWVKKLPYDFRIQTGLVLGLSTDLHKAYHTARELKKGTNTDYVANNTFVDQYSNIRFEAHPQLNGTNFMYITTDDNIGLMVDRPGEESMITLEKTKRNINAFADYKLGVYFKAFGASVDDNAALNWDNQIFFSNDEEVLNDVFVPVTANDTTPSVKDHHALIIGANNTAATNVTKLDDVVEGVVYYLMGNSDVNVSTIKNNADIILADGDYALADGNEIVLIGLAGGKVIEYSRTVAGATPEPEKVTLAADATTADASTGTWFVTQANTGATALTNINNAINGETYTIEGGSGTNSTTIASGGNFLLTASFTASDGAILKVKYNGTKFIEVSRS